MDTEELQFLDESLPALDDEEMEDLYRHFLVDDMPEDDDGDEDFEPSPVEDDDEGEEEAGVRRRNIQSRELNDLLQDAYKQLGPSLISPGLRERVLDQLSMHFQLLLQTGVLAKKAFPRFREQGEASLGMLEHLAHGSRKAGSQTRTTRARGKISSVWWDDRGDRLPPVGIPGLLPANTLRGDIMEAAGSNQQLANSQQTLERLVTSRGGVIWPQLLPGNVREGISGYLNSSESRESDGRDRGAREASNGIGPPSVVAGARDNRSIHSASGASAFSMVEDRLLCRGIQLHNVAWNTIKDKFLPHKPVEALMHRYAILSGWASIQGTTQAAPAAQTCTLPWTHEEDLKLRDAVQKHGKKWAFIAREVLPYRGRGSLRSRWGALQAISGGGGGSTNAKKKLAGVDARSPAVPRGNARPEAPVQLFGRKSVGAEAPPQSGATHATASDGRAAGSTPSSRRTSNPVPQLGVNHLAITPGIPLNPASAHGFPSTNANLTTGAAHGLTGGNPWLTQMSMAASWNAAGGGGAGNLLAPAGIPPFGGMHTIPLMLPCPLPMPGMTNLPGTIADGQSGHGTGREDAWNSKDQPSSNQDAAGQMVGTKRGRGRPRKEQTLTGSDTAVENQAGSVDSAGGDGWLDRASREQETPTGTAADGVREPLRVSTKAREGPANPEIEKRSAQSRIRERVEYAEDELSDDSDDFDTLVTKNGYERSSNGVLESERGRKTPPRDGDFQEKHKGVAVTPAERLYEEDELSDNGDDSS